MKEVNDEEELYALSGWDSIEDNLSYSDIYIKKLQQQIAAVVSSKLPQSPSLPKRTHLRNKSKEYFSSKISSGQIKRDKEFLQQYIKREKASSPRANISHFQDPSPDETMKNQTQIPALVNEKHHHHKTTEILVSGIKSPLEESCVLEKYLLFSGANKSKSKKRRFFLKVDSSEVNNKKNLREIKFPSEKQGKMSQQLTSQKIDEIEVERPDFSAHPKKGLKFPLFYRQLHSNEQHLRKDKYKSTINLRQKMELKFSEQFTDDNIFQTRFIRA